VIGRALESLESGLCAGVGCYTLMCSKDASTYNEKCGSGSG